MLFVEACSKNFLCCFESTALCVFALRCVWCTLVKCGLVCKRAEPPSQPCTIAQMQQCTLVTLCWVHQHWTKQRKSNVNMIRTQWTGKNVQIKSDGRLEQKWALEDRWCWEGWVGGWWARAQGGLGRSAPPPADASQSASSRPSPKTKMREIVHLQVGFCPFTYIFAYFYLLYLHCFITSKTWNATSSSLSAILLYHLMYHDAFCCQTKTLNSPKCSKSILTIIWTSGGPVWQSDWGQVLGDHLRWTRKDS